jgi:hypothetical protein
MQTIMERRGNKFDHLRKLAGGNEGAVGFRHHKYTIEGQPLMSAKRGSAQFRAWI